MKKVRYALCIVAGERARETICEKAWVQAGMVPRLRLALQLHNLFQM